MFISHELYIMFYCMDAYIYVVYIYIYIVNVGPFVCLSTLYV